MNHSRCCANDNGNACSRAARSSAGIFRPPLFSLLTSSICFPSPATVGFSNRLLNPTSTPSTLLTRDTTCVASNECPPNSKKFSSLPTRSRFNTCAHTPATNSSVAVLAPPSPLPPSPSLPSPLSSLPFSPLFGIPFRSTFPFTVSGIRSIHTHSPGTMYSGNLLCTYLLNSSFVVLSPPPPRFPSPPPPSSCFPSPPSLPLPSPSSPSLLTTSATSRWSPSPSFSTTTTACPTPPCSPNTASISPNSIRYPLIFTCSSFLPKYSSSPPSLHLTRSPLRYSLLPPSSLYPCGTNRSAVCPAWFTYPRANPAPPIYNSPHTPSGTNSPSSSSTYTSTFAIGRPILGSSFSPSASDMLAHTVTSVGPYASISLLPSPHFLTTSFVHASPTTTSVLTLFISSAFINPSNDGGIVITSTPSRLTNSVSPSPGSSSSFFPITSVPPLINAINTSH